MEQMILRLNNMRRNYLIFLVTICGAILAHCGLAFAEDHVLPLKISWDKQTEKIVVTRPPLTRSVGDLSRWIFKLELSPDLEMVTGPNWHHDTAVNHVAQNWGLWAGVAGDPFAYAFSTPDQPNATFHVWADGRIRRKRGLGAALGANGAAADEIDFEANWSGETTGISVVFDPDIIKTGYSKSLPNQGVELERHIQKIVHATVVPPEETNNIVFSRDPATADRATWEVTDKNTTTGVITLSVSGSKDKGSSPANLPNGDMTIWAKKNGNDAVLGSAVVVIVIPYAISANHPEVNKAFEPENVQVDSNTSPVDPNAPAGKTALTTVYGPRMSIQAEDQFGAPLDSCYSQADVWEDMGNGFQYTNMRISDNGTYEDPVVVFGEGAVVVDDNKEELITMWLHPKPGDTFPWWQPALTQHFPMAIDEPQVQNYGVAIAGHQLATGIVNRKVSSIAPNIVKIEWPN